MKSIIMAVFLASVSLGNFFTAAVNSFIQVPNPLKEIAASVGETSPAVDAIRTETHPGFDGKAGTPDDIKLTFQGKDLIKTEFPGYAQFQEAKSRLIAKMEETKSILSNEEANTLVADLKDPWGQAINYTVSNSKKARLTSPGADKTEMTQWDMGLNLSVPEDKKSEETGTKSQMTWLEKRQEELDAKSADLELESPDDAFVGGQTKLEGASYFWFFTWVMLGTAITFVVVAIYYKPRSYLQDASDAEEAEATAEAIAQ
jgi:POT family proton-dependent oligopeptide transporter